VGSRAALALAVAGGLLAGCSSPGGGSGSGKQGDGSRNQVIGASEGSAGVVLAATATGAAGPIGFIALTAPQLARRLTRTPHLPLLSSALTGAVVLVGADLVARTLLPPLEIPVGALTSLVGGPYLLWLLGRR
jgi:ABC-type cobalamin transport system permease subunit